MSLALPKPAAPGPGPGPGPVPRTPTPVSDDEDAFGSDDEAEPTAKRARKKKPKAGAGGGGGGGAAEKGEYKYGSEITAMMFVFGETFEPLTETVRLIEDIVRGQIIEIVTRARLLTHLRSSRFLSAEDLIFLIRDDRGKVNRLRTYLSWKDVRKRAKDEEGQGGNAAEPEVDDELDEADKSTLKARKTMVKLPWELLTPFSEFLRSIPSSQNKEDEDDEDEDELLAYQDSMQRLRDADEITRMMTRAEYEKYSECRQASFTYRKARRFREFINFGAYLDVRPNDDIIDILGFLSFEMVRSLCETALDVRSRHEAPIPVSVPVAAQPTAKNQSQSHTSTSPLKRRATLTHTTTATALDSTTSASGTPAKRARVVDSPEAIDISPARRQTSTSHGHGHAPVSLFAPPAKQRQPLLPVHILEAYAQIQRQQAAARVGGTRNWRGGIGRGRMALV